jgi:hypothetical protein
MESPPLWVWAIIIGGYNSWQIHLSMDNDQGIGQER